MVQLDRTRTNQDPASLRCCLCKWFLHYSLLLTPGTDSRALCGYLKRYSVGNRQISKNVLYCYIAGVFFSYHAPIHWLVHGHMTSKNETVSRQMPWAGNIAKTMTSNGRQFTITREMLIAVARWNRSAVFKICFCFVLLYNKSLNDWSFGEQWILFPSNLGKHWDSLETKFTVPLGTSS